MKNKNQAEKLDRLLDEISGRLRDEQCPPVPDELLDATNDDNDIKVTIREDKIVTGHLGWWLAGAAAVIIACLWIVLPQFGSQVVKNDPGLKPIGDGGIAIQNLASLRPFAFIEKEINEMEKEIELLKKEAVLLDAYRKANSLIAQK